MSTEVPMGEGCAFHCWRTGQDDHHFLGRGVDGDYIEPKGTVRLCTWHHRGVIHRSWRRFGVEVLDEHATPSEVCRVALRRAADFAVLAGTCDESVALEPDSWSAFGHFLGEAATIWEQDQQ